MDETVDYLTEEPPLHTAAKDGNVALVQAILDSGADIDAIFFPHTALGVAAFYGHFDVAKTLLERGANPDLCDEVPPLMAAIHSEHESIARLLVEHHADPNDFDMERQTALMWAARNNLESTVQLLLQAGARPNMHDSLGRKALDYAVERGNNEIAEMLRPLTPDYFDDIESW